MMPLFSLLFFDLLLERLCDVPVRHYLRVFSPPRLERFFAISGELTSDFATLALLDATAAEGDSKQEQRAMDVFCHPAFESWSKTHGKVFNQHMEKALSQKVEKVA